MRTHIKLAIVSIVLLGAASPMTSVNAAPAPDVSPLSRVCISSPLGYIDFTEQAGDELPNDVPLGNARGQLGPALVFFGFASRFDALSFQLGDVPAGDGTIDWYYWNGVWWAPAAVDDETASFHNSGLLEVRLKNRDHWTPTAIPSANCPESLYYIMAGTHDTYDLVPMASQVWALH